MTNETARDPATMSESEGFAAAVGPKALPATNAGARWTEVAELSASDGERGGRFGRLSDQMAGAAGVGPRDDVLEVARERLAPFASPDGCVFGMTTRVATW